VGNAFLPTVFIGKGWANDKAVCLPYKTITFSVIETVFLSARQAQKSIINAA